MWIFLSLYPRVPHVPNVYFFNIIKILIVLLKSPEINVNEQKYSST